MGAHIYSRILLSHKIERMPFAATWMQLEIIILSKKEKNTYYVTYMWNVKYDTNEPIYETNMDTEQAAGC